MRGLQCTVKNTANGCCIRYSFGGGTPSVFGAKRLCRVLEKVKEQFNVAENVEITTECNPADVDVSVF